jgi:hypothetical protein
LAAVDFIRRALFYPTSAAARWNPVPILYMGREEEVLRITLEWLRQHGLNP